MPGRRSKLTPAIHAAIVQAVTDGVPLERAAALAEVSPSCLKQWYQRGDGTHPTRSTIEPYVSFVREIKKAYAQDEARRVLRINQAGQGGAVLEEKTVTYPDGRIERQVKRAQPQWQADAWHLERSRPDDWARREKVDIRMTIQQAAQKVADELGMTAEEVLAEAERLLQT